MAAPPVNTPQLEKIFKDSTWQAQAERPDILGQLGSKWREFLAGKGQGLKAYVEDLQLAYKMLRDPLFQIAKETQSLSEKVTLWLPNASPSIESWRS
jgi:hypothetical protein